MKRVISLAAATLLLAGGAVTAAAPALAAPKAKPRVATSKPVGPTTKWAATLDPVVEGSVATGHAQVVQTRSRRLPVYSLSVKGSGLDPLVCHEVSTSVDRVTWTVLGQSTTSDTGALSFGRRVASPAEVAVLVAECGAEAVLAGGSIALR